MPLTPEEQKLQDILVDQQKRGLMDPVVIEAVKTIQEKIAGLDVSPSERDLYLRSLIDTTNRKRKWGLSTVAPYYNTKAAIEMRVVLDKMFEDSGSDIKILLSQQHRTLNSMYAKINQGWNFLMDKMDQRGRYRFLRERIRIRKEENGIALRWKHNPIESERFNCSEPFQIITMKHTGLQPEPSLEEELKRHEAITQELGEEVTKKKIPQLIWREKLDAFIEMAEENTALDLKNIMIMPEQQEGIKQLFETLDGFHLLLLTDSRLKVFKGTMPTL